MGNGIETLKKVNFTRLEQESMRLIRKHGDDNAELEKDLFGLIEMIQEEKSHNEDIKSFAFALANKI